RQKNSRRSFRRADDFRRRRAAMKRVLVALVLAACGCAKPALPDYGVLPEFRLIAQDGKAFGSAELKGFPWVADLIYTSCPGPCPILSTRMASLQGKLPAN